MDGGGARLRWRRRSSATERPAAWGLSPIRARGARSAIGAPPRSGHVLPPAAAGGCHGPVTARRRGHPASPLARPSTRATSPTATASRHHPGPHDRGPPRRGRALPLPPRPAPGGARAGTASPHLERDRRTRTDLELHFLALCERHGLPRPLVNHRVGGHLASTSSGATAARGRDRQLRLPPRLAAFEDDHARPRAARRGLSRSAAHRRRSCEAAPEAVVADLSEAPRRCAS